LAPFFSREAPGPEGRSHPVCDLVFRRLAAPCVLTDFLGGRRAVFRKNHTPGRYGIYVRAVQREPTPGGSGLGWRRCRRRFPCQYQPAAALILYIESVVVRRKLGLETDTGVHEDQVDLRRCVDIEPPFSPFDTASLLISCGSYFFRDSWSRCQHAAAGQDPKPARGIRAKHPPLPFLFKSEIYVCVLRGAAQGAAGGGGVVPLQTRAEVGVVGPRPSRPFPLAASRPQQPYWPLPYRLAKKEVCWRFHRPGRAGMVFTCTWCSASRLPAVRGWAGAGAAGASHASCRSGSIY
jgi:hypothetical protein